jgi:hypothetical protein
MAGSIVPASFVISWQPAPKRVLPGPGKLLRWSVPPGRGHDDLLVSAALTERLDTIDWRNRTARGSGLTGT